MARMLSTAPPEAKEAGGSSSEALRPSAVEIDAARAALRSACLDHGVAPPPAAEEPLAAWLALLARWGRRRRLAGPRSLPDLAVELVVDSLYVDRLAPERGTLLDVGSGAGVPGLPLAILGPARAVTLVEPAPARTAVQRLAATALGLSNLRVLGRRAEDLAGDVAAGREPAADAAVARAFLPPEEWLALARRLVRPGGTALVLAGARWPGPSAPACRVVQRLDYRLHGRQARTVWCIRLETESSGGGG